MKYDDRDDMWGTDLEVRGRRQEAGNLRLEIRSLRYGIEPHWTVKSLNPTPMVCFCTYYC